MESLPARVVAVIEQMDFHDFPRLALPDDMDIQPSRQAARTHRSCELNESGGAYDRNTGPEHTSAVGWGVPE